MLRLVAQHIPVEERSFKQPSGHAYLLAALFVEFIRHVFVEFGSGNIFAFVAFADYRKGHAGIICAPAGVKGGRSALLECYYRAIEAVC